MGNTITNPPPSQPSPATDYDPSADDIRRNQWNQNQNPNPTHHHGHHGGHHHPTDNDTSSTTAYTTQPSDSDLAVSNLNHLQNGTGNNQS